VDGNSRAAAATARITPLSGYRINAFTFTVGDIIPLRGSCAAIAFARFSIALASSLRLSRFKTAA
jgi:hypothetical protein